MSAAGIVSLPGMMTGQILAGTPPVEAVKYQILVMFLIAGGTGFGTMVAVSLAARRLFRRPPAPAARPPEPARQLNPQRRPVTRAAVQRLTRGTISDACFSACLADFFSLGVNSGCFFCSLLPCLILPMIVLLVSTRERRCLSSIGRS
jgi:hypothetical protein